MEALFTVVHPEKIKSSLETFKDLKGNVHVFDLSVAPSFLWGHIRFKEKVLFVTVRS